MVAFYEQHGMWHTWYMFCLQMGPSGGASAHLPQQLAVSSGLNGDHGAPPSDVEGGVGSRGWLGSASNPDMKSLQVLEELMHKVSMWR